MDELKDQLRAVELLLTSEPDNDDLKQAREQILELIALSDEVNSLRGPETDMFDSDLENLGDPLVLMSIEPETVNLLDKYVPVNRRVAFTSVGIVEGEVLESLKGLREFDTNGLTQGYNNKIDKPKEGPRDGVAEWEEHTRGIGSKLLIKMGYIRGTGLGSKKTGIAEPLGIDRQAGETKFGLGHKARDSSISKALRKQALKAGLEDSVEEDEAQEETVFDFMNSALNKHVQQAKPEVPVSHRGLSLEELRKRLTHVQEKIAEMQQYIVNKKTSYDRNIARDSVTALMMLEKAQQGEAELSRLQAEEKELKIRLDIRSEGTSTKKQAKKVF